MRRGWRSVFDRRLVEGLTVDERIARLEGALERAGERIELLEKNERRRRGWSMLDRLVWAICDRGF